MKSLPKNYEHKEAEKRWQAHWLEQQTYAWEESLPREQTFVIDTPPPTVSGLLHMGHIFSYTQADFVARYQRMAGKTVFYPMGFDDNGLPTERLVEKVKKVRATDMSREDFTALCESVAEEARGEFRELFRSVALSVDWNQEYHTIGADERKLSQMSFLDLYHKGHAYRELKPFFWDPVDQTAIAQAEIEDKELPSNFVDIVFGVEESRVESRESNKQSHDSNHSTLTTITIGTTRPELLPACVGVFYHPDDERYQHLKGKFAVTPLFGVRVPILTDDTVEIDKGTGIMMCCTFGDEKDIEKWRKHKLETRIILNKYGKIDETLLRAATTNRTDIQMSPDWVKVPSYEELIASLANKKISNADPKNLGAREIISQIVQDAQLLINRKLIVHAVKCAERSGAPLEILPTQQWFVRITDKKEALKAKAAECEWKPPYMKLRIDQWIDGLNSDWCISRQRYFGVPFPVWYVRKLEKTNTTGFGINSDGSINKDDTPYETYSGSKREIITATLDQLPLNPLTTPPAHIFPLSRFAERSAKNGVWEYQSLENPEDWYLVEAEKDVMDTWATSSISPQLSAKGISSSCPDMLPAVARMKEPARPSAETWNRASAADPASAAVVPNANSENAASVTDRPSKETAPFILDETRYSKLFPADMRPQAHEIIRTWAFYTIVKAYLHADEATRDLPGNGIPWKHLMISGWCLAADKTKMSKSKGNVVTPVALIEEKGSDAVRYWASTSRLGADTAFSEDLLKIGRKLVTKLWNATQFASLNLPKLAEKPATPAADIACGRIGETLDLWVLTRLARAVEKATAAFETFEYADARVASEDFFWNDFCDNYLELVKTRAYGEPGDQPTRSALFTLHHCLNAILKLFAPFVPHIAEELFAHIFDAEYANTGSIHARGMWPRASDYSLDTPAEATGIAAVSLLNAIRKAKSERNVSIKFPIKELVIAAGPTVNAIRLQDLESVIEDIKAAGSVEKVSYAAAMLDAETVTADNAFALKMTFAPAAANAAESEATSQA